MRILLLYDCLYPEVIGGVERRNRELARVLAGRGHAVTLAAWSRGGRRVEDGVEILPLGPPPGSLYNRHGKRSTADALRFARAVARLDPAAYDVVETANIPYAHLPWLARRCRRRGVPLVVTWYEYWGRYWRHYLGWKWPLYAAVERLTVPLGDLALADSALTGRRVAARRREELEVVPCGIDVAAIEAAAAGGGGGPPLVYAGRLVREKRLDLLLRAVAEIAGRRPGELLHVVGDGNDRPRLEALAAELGLAGRVRFAGHLATAAEVWREIGRGEVAVQPSSREGFGIFPLEALACGLPVVYCESPENAVGEVVRDGVDGRCTAATPAALAEALDRLLRDGAERRRLAESARRRAREYDWASVADRLEAAFRRVLPGSPAGW